MGCASDDIEAEERMTGSAVEELQKKYPQHELLKYWILPPEDANPDGTPKDPEKEKRIADEMKDRFWGGSRPWREVEPATVKVHTLAHYRNAVRQALYS